MHPPSGHNGNAFLFRMTSKVLPLCSRPRERERDPIFCPPTPRRGASQKEKALRTFSFPSRPKEKQCLGPNKAWPTEDFFTDPQSPFRSPGTSYLLLRTTIPQGKGSHFSLCPAMATALLIQPSPATLVLCKYRVRVKDQSRVGSGPGTGT